MKAAKPAKSKNWKVVVGRNIEYKATSEVDGNWDWKIGTGPCGTIKDYWEMKPTTASNYLRASVKGTHEAIIPITKLPATNDAFGVTNGTIQVTLDGSSSCLSKDGGEAVAEVYFEKDKNDHPGGVTPNWFFYWEQIPIIQNLLNSVPGIPLYNFSTHSFSSAPVKPILKLRYIEDFPYAYSITPTKISGAGTYGASYFGPEGWNKQEEVGLPPLYVPNPPGKFAYEYGVTKSLYIDIGPGCGFIGPNDSDPNPPCKKEPDNGWDYGIHVFYRTVRHEIEHAIIACEVWNYTHPSQPSHVAGYNDLWDTDFDGYKDIWEKYVGYSFGFKVGVQDAYSIDYETCYCAKTCSKATMYEEERCRKKEIELNLNEIDQFDWSFDPTDDIQGKMWKK